MGASFIVGTPILHEAIVENQVFFIGNLGYIMPAQVRQIGFEESSCFERLPCGHLSAVQVLN